MDDLRLYILFGAAFCFFCLVTSLLLLLYKIREKVLKLIREVKEAMIWNGTIRSITIVYIQFCISFGQ